MRRQAQLRQQARSADEDVVAVDRGPRAATGQRLEAGGGRLDAGCLAPSTIARASGCSESASTAAASPRPVRLHRARRDVDEDRLAPVRVPVLSKIDHVEVRARSSASRSLTSRPFRAPSEVEIAITSGIARPSAWGQAMTSTVAVRTSAPSGSPCSHQNDERDDAGAEGDVEQHGGRPVGQGLGMRCRGLRRGDQAHDPRQRGRVAGRRHPDPQRAARGDRARDDGVAGLLGDRARLAGDHRLVDVGAALDDHAIGGDASTGPDEHDVADCQGRDRHLLGPGVGDPLGGVGQQRPPAR